MTIGELAKRCGVNVETVRYYERRGLISDPRPRGVGYRDYRESDARRLAFIKQAQGLGFTLKEIAELLDLRVSSETACPDVRALTEAKIVAIEEKIETLQTFKAALTDLVSHCDTVTSIDACPLFDALDAAQAAANSKTLLQA